MKVTLPCSVFFSQAQQAHHDGIRGRSFLWLQLYLGLAWTVGCIFFGAVADNRWLHFWSFGPYQPLLFQEKNTNFCNGSKMVLTVQKWAKNHNWIFYELCIGNSHFFICVIWIQRTLYKYFRKFWNPSMLEVDDLCYWTYNL